LDRENSEFIVGLWETVEAFVRNRNLSSSVLDWLRSDGGQYNALYYYNNFEIVRIKPWQSDFYRDFIDWIHRSGGIYLHRWGDAPLRTIAASLLQTRGAFRDEKLTDFMYMHHGVALPDGLMRYVCVLFWSVPVAVFATVYLPVRMSTVRVPFILAAITGIVLISPWLFSLLTAAYYRD
jgi:hypothetical protein